MTGQTLLTIAYSSNYTAEQNEIFERMLLRTSGFPHENITIQKYENFNQFSLSEVYNKALIDSDSETILFIHNDTLFLENDWGPSLVKVLAESEYGILGIAGTAELNEKRDKGAWFDSGQDNTLGLIFHPHHKDGIIDLWWSGKASLITPAVVVDGVFLLVNRSRIKENFDEDFKGYHFYDVSFCIRNFKCGVKIGVITNHSIKLYHNSTGNLTPEWEENRNLFLRKYPGNFLAERINDVELESYNPFPIENMQRFVHIIILTKDQLKLLFDLLDSIFTTTVYANYCVWIGDTGSEEPNKVLIRQKLEELNNKSDAKNSLSKTKRGISHYNFLDIGFYHYSKVNNLIVSLLAQQGHCVVDDFLLFCNNDVKFINHCIDGCLYEYEQKSKEGVNIGTLGIKLLFENNRIQHLGIDIFHRGDNRIFISHRFLGYRYGFSTESEYTVGNTGAFMFVEYETFKKVGGFNESYKDVYQDVEFNLECLKHGLKNITLGSLVAYHYESQTRASDSSIWGKSAKDWSDILFPYIISNLHLSKYFRIVEDVYEKGVYNKLIDINYEKRYSIVKK
ncbi:hypothetical protein GCM10011386_30470 [Parapedobacter defluvii]|uniref:Streptomycin biosynthesis protein StrF domain-containing protein n=1 Tax=Parapedobacter defluvii TaxID=2045106 RepID=A0ABQ1M817_9SPHI|nr:glycosyltransferase [Parapedobacter defluvii]GGC36230.1 hypothetical protein GCM10011386_30470 [Parapedobacter defluvii]